jgi:hypothetical protein
MVNFRAICGCCTRTDIVREHLEDTLRICDVSAMGLYSKASDAGHLLHMIYLVLTEGHLMWSVNI